MKRVLLAAGALILLAACGQKGPLQLPDEPGEVVNTAAPATEGTAESGKEKEDSARPRQ